MPFLEKPQRLQRPAIHQAKIAGIAGKLKACQFLEDAVKHERQAALQQGFAVTLFTLSVNNIIAFAPLGQHFIDQLGRILKISVDY